MAMTYDTLRAQYAANAQQMARMAAQARETQRLVRGKSSAYWAAQARTYQAVSELDDAGLAAHLRAAQASVTARLATIRAGR